MSVTKAVEIERKYAVPDGAELPVLNDLALVVERHDTVELDAVYFDTADRALLAAGIVVRRRRGGVDEGWHVKLRGTTGRQELHAAIDPAAPESLPLAFRAALGSRLRSRPVEPIARIRTQRTAVVVTDDAGGGVEVVDDLVTATDVAAGVDRSWREWEAEQATDSSACEALLDRVDRVLRDAGATESASPAKIAQALGLVGAPPAPAPPTAGSTLAAGIGIRTEQLHRGIQSLVLDGDPDGVTVHTMRKALRRARSLLALRSVAGPSGAVLRDGLGELGRLLGTVRDPLVAARTVAELLDDLDPGTPGAEDARALLVAAPLAEQPVRTAALLEALASPATHALLADLEAFAPDGPDADADPSLLARIARREVRRARRRARAGVDGDLDAMHRARRAAKRARFVVAEVRAAGVAVPKQVVRQGKRDASAQDVLGAHRDLALVLEALPAASERLAASGGNAFALGRIAERGRARLALLRLRAQRVVRRLG